MTLVIELDKVAYDLLTGKIETANIDLFSTLIQAVQNGTPFPDNATNGDVIKTLFPNAEFWDSTEFENEERINFEGNDCLECLNFDWWSAPYKKEEKQ